MINIEDQETLFKVISQKLKKDLTCYAFGGNAMMYYGYKNATKDVDILFETEYKRISLSGIYSDLQVKDPHKPEMYMLKDERFDLFMGKIFRMYISKSMKERVWGKYKLGNEWVVLDMEEFLQKLKKQVYIKEEYFDRLYSVFAKKKKS